MISVFSLVAETFNDKQSGQNCENITATSQHHGKTILKNTENKDFSTCKNVNKVSMIIKLCLNLKPQTNYFRLQF